MCGMISYVGFEFGSILAVLVVYESDTFSNPSYYVIHTTKHWVIVTFI